MPANLNIPTNTLTFNPEEVHFSWDEIKPIEFNIAPKQKVLSKKEELPTLTLEEYKVIHSEYLKLSEINQKFRTDIHLIRIDNERLKLELKKALSLPTLIKSFNKFLKGIGSYVKIKDDDPVALNRFLDEVWKFIRKDPKDEVAE